MKIFMILRRKLYSIWKKKFQVKIIIFNKKCVAEISRMSRSKNLVQNLVEFHIKSWSMNVSNMVDGFLQFCFECELMIYHLVFVITYYLLDLLRLPVSICRLNQVKMEQIPMKVWWLIVLSTEILQMSKVHFLSCRKPFSCTELLQSSEATTGGVL